MQQATIPVRPIPAPQCTNILLPSRRADTQRFTLISKQFKVRWNATVFNGREFHGTRKRSLQYSPQIVRSPRLEWIPRAKADQIMTTHSLNWAAN